MRKRQGRERIVRNQGKEGRDEKKNGRERWRRKERRVD